MNGEKGVMLLSLNCDMVECEMQVGKGLQHMLFPGWWFENDPEFKCTHWPGHQIQSPANSNHSVQIIFTLLA